MKVQRFREWNGVPTLFAFSSPFRRLSFDFPECQVVWHHSNGFSPIFEQTFKRVASVAGRSDWDGVSQRQIKNVAGVSHFIAADVSAVVPTA